MPPAKWCLLLCYATSGRRVLPDNHTNILFAVASCRGQLDWIKHLSCRHGYADRSRSLPIKHYMKNKLTTLYILAVLALTPSGALAAPTSPAVWINGIFTNVLNKVVWPIFLGLVIIMFIWAGVLYLTAHGDPSRVNAANKAVVYAVIGIIVAILSFSAVNIIRGLITPPTTTITPGSVPVGGSCTTNADCSSGNCPAGTCMSS